MLCMARARRRSARPSGLDPRRVNRSHFARRSVAAACPHRARRLERFEPYEGKLSSTVLRGGGGLATARLHSTLGLAHFQLPVRPPKSPSPPTGENPARPWGRPSLSVLPSPLAPAVTV